MSLAEPKGQTVADKIEFGPHEVNVLHGLVGVITEAGEMAEALMRWLDTGKIDAVNVNEESGDVLWYIVRGLRGIDRSLEHCMKTNVDKLHGRHGEAFDPFRDANRDLEAERARLEQAEAPEAPLLTPVEEGEPRKGRVVPGTENL